MRSYPRAGAYYGLPFKGDMIVYARRASTILFNLLLSNEGDRPFLLPANICPIVPITFRKARRTFHLMDIDSLDLGLDRTACLDLLRQNPEDFAGVLYVRPYGALGDCSTFFHAIHAIRNDLLVIDDRCLCRPDPDGEGIDPAADVTLYSTGYGKPVDIGTGGFAHLVGGVPYRPQQLRFDASALQTITRRYKIALARRWPFVGPEEDWLDGDSPALAWAEYRERALEEDRRIESHRCRLNAIYAEELPRSLQLPSRFQQWRFQIRAPQSRRLLRRLRVAGLFASQHYAALGGGIFTDGRFPRAEALHRVIVNLFNDRYYDESQAIATARIVREHVAACSSGSVRERSKGASNPYGIGYGGEA